LIEYITYDSLGSTFQTLKQLVQSKRPQHPVVITCDQQTAGIGTHGRQWFSQPHTALLYSIALYTYNPVIEPTTLVAYVATSLATVTQQLCRISLVVTYPNDMMLGGKKCAGILTANVVQGPHCWTIIGIGMNVNTDKFPASLSHKATSLYLHTGRRYPIAAFIVPLSEKLVQEKARVMYTV